MNYYFSFQLLLKMVILATIFYSEIELFLCNLENICVMFFLRADLFDKYCSNTACLIRVTLSMEIYTK